DAIAAAGGFAEDADQGSVNLARLLLDAEQLRVRAIGEAEAPGAAGARSDGRVDLNTADTAALQTLPGVGPAIAARIIAWRETSGGFRSVADLLAVSGIGPRTFESIQPLVTV